MVSALLSSQHRRTEAVGTAATNKTVGDDRDATGSDSNKKDGGRKNRAE